MGTKKIFLSNTSVCFPEHLCAFTEGEECGCLPCASVSITSTVHSNKLLILLYLNMWKERCGCSQSSFAFVFAVSLTTLR